MEFKANCVTWQNVDGVAMLGFADDEFKTKQYLLLQRKAKPDQKERALGMDKVHFELNSQLKSAYGDVEEVQIENQRVVFRLDPATAQTVGNGEDIEIALDLDAKKLKQVADSLYSGPRKLDHRLSY